MADGIFYRDLRQPFMIGDQTAITLLTTSLDLWPPALTTMPANYWTTGKTVKLTAWGKMTTALTPGNIVVGVGCGPANPPANIKLSLAKALTASQTDVAWRFEAYAVCRGIGTGGATATMMVYGQFTAHVAVLASTLQPVFVPDTANVNITTLDPTLATNALVMTANRSGSTAEAMTTQGLFVEALN